MDIWVVAVAAGAGFLEKYWQSSSSKGKEGLIDSIHGQGQSGSGNFPSLRLKWKHRNEEFHCDGIDFVDSSSSKSDHLDKDTSENGEENGVFNSYSELFFFREMGSTSRAKIEKNKYMRTKNNGYFVKPLNSLETCLAAQLYREHCTMEEFVFSSHRRQPSTTVARPLLVMDGSRIISRASIHFNWKMQSQRKSQATEMENPKQKNGTQSGIVFFFLGISLGMMSTIYASKREVDKLNDMLKQTENQLQDLEDELEMKHLFTVTELKAEGLESCGTPPYSTTNSEPASGEMSNIKAELEAELERLEFNFRTSNSEENQMSFPVNPDFVPDLGSLSDSTDYASQSSDNHVINGQYTVSPWELSLHLHKVIQSRLVSRIKELEMELENSQRSSHLRRIISEANLYEEIVSASTRESLTYSDVDDDIEQPSVMNLSGKALAGYSEA